MSAQRKVTATYGKRKKSTLTRQKVGGYGDHDIFKDKADSSHSQLNQDELMTTRPTLRSRMATPTKHTRSLSKDSATSNLSETSRGVLKPQILTDTTVESTSRSTFESNTIRGQKTSADTVAHNDGEWNEERSKFQSSTLLYPFDRVRKEKKPKLARYSALNILPEVEVLRELEVNRRAAQKTTQQSSDSLDVVLPQDCSSDEGLEIPNYNSSPLAASTPKRRFAVMASGIDDRKRKHTSDAVPIARHFSLKKARQDDNCSRNARKPHERTTSLNSTNSASQRVSKDLSDPFSDDNMIVCDEDTQNTTQNDMQIDEQENQQSLEISVHTADELEVGRRDQVQPREFDSGFQLETVVDFTDLELYHHKSSSSPEILDCEKNTEQQVRRTNRNGTNQVQAQRGALQTDVDGSTEARAPVCDTHETSSRKTLHHTFQKENDKSKGLRKHNLPRSRPVSGLDPDEDKTIQATKKGRVDVEGREKHNQQRQEESLVPTGQSCTKLSEKVKKGLQNNFKRYVLKPIQNIPDNVRTGLCVRRANTKPDQKTYANAELDELQALMLD